MIPYTDSNTHGFVVMLGGEAVPCRPVNWMANGELLYSIGDGVTRLKKAGQWGRFEYDASTASKRINFAPKKSTEAA